MAMSFPTGRDTGREVIIDDSCLRLRSPIFCYDFHYGRLTARFIITQRWWYCNQPPHQFKFSGKIPGLWTLSYFSTKPSTFHPREYIRTFQRILRLSKIIRHRNLLDFQCFQILPKGFFTKCYNIKRRHLELKQAIAALVYGGGHKQCFEVITRE